MKTAGISNKSFAGALAAIMVAALALRLWGIQYGLPFIYNLDEGAHFVPKAVAFFGAGYDPHYFINPPAFSYLLHGIFWAWFGGRGGVSHAYALDPAAIFTVARVTAAVLGTAAVGFTAAIGARLYDRRVGLVAAVLIGVAFLPVFYAHFALNDVPALLPLTVSLYGTAGILVRERRRDWVYAGLGLGLGCATKYTAGIVLLPLLTVVVLRLLDAGRDRKTTLVLAALAGAVAVAAFVIANPYSVLSPHEFGHDLTQQQSAAGETGGKLGQTQSNGVFYYLWTLTWGFGWLPAVAAAAGALLAFRIDWRRALVLVPYPILFIVFMGLQQRYFGRWVLPVMPALAILAALPLVVVFDGLRFARPVVRRAAYVIAVAALATQSLYHSIHVDRVLAREDTRTAARGWLVDNVPAAGKLAIEPVVPQSYIQDPGHPLPATPSGNRWIKFSTGKTSVPLKDTVAGDNAPQIVNVEDYERTTRPELIGSYRRGGYCTVMIGSTQYGRAYNDPRQVPNALPYYRKLQREGEVVYRTSPYKRGAKPVKFDFDYSFNYYPLSYARPGPEVTIYRLRGGACG